MGESLQLLDIIIPKDIGDLKLPSPELLDVYEDRQNRVIYIDYDIDEDLMRDVGRQIIEYNRKDKGLPVEKRKPVVILINSCGGCLDSTYATVAIIEASKTPVYTVNTNCAYCAAGLLLIAGHKRYCMPRSQVLIHSGSASGISGTFEEVQENAKSYKKMVEEMRELIISKTKIDKNLMKKNQSRDWYLSVDQQLELGCVDEILTDLDLII